MCSQYIAIHCNTVSFVSFSPRPKAGTDFVVRNIEALKCKFLTFEPSDRRFPWHQYAPMVSICVFDIQSLISNERLQHARFGIGALSQNALRAQPTRMND